MSRSKKITAVGAVHPRSARDVLDALGLAEPLERGELRCAECKAQLSLDNIAGMRKADGEIVLCCASTACQESFNDR